MSNELLRIAALKKQVAALKADLAKERKTSAKLLDRVSSAELKGFKRFLRDCINNY